LAASIKTLSSRGIRPLKHAAIVDLGSFRLVGLNFIGAGDVKGYPVVRREDRHGRPLANTDVTRLCDTVARPPVVAFVHWGKEYTAAASESERAIAAQLATCGIGLIVGAHSHQASGNFELVGGGQALMLYSMGNLIFDQVGPFVSGAVVELRVFKQGTISARLIAAPNLYQAARSR
jgi:poly-gamma-glutamate capsule biosynthesis protein CapA/YwtB (metallophosphatase superfamily)